MSIFNKYQDVNEPDMMFAPGIKALCHDLNIHPENPRMLILAWKMDATVMCRFTRAEFLRGLSAMGVDTVPAMSCRLVVAAQEVRATFTSFTELYKWSFNFALDKEARQRCLPLDMAVAIWRIVFAVHTATPPPLLEPWLAFLEQRPMSFPITRDQWSYFLKFLFVIGDDLNKYSEDDAWPNVIDDFVEHLKYRQSQTVGSNTQRKEDESMFC